MDRCPDPEQLRGLLEDHLSEAERGPLARHVDDCRPCQERLERLTAAAPVPNLPDSPSWSPTLLPRPDFLRKLKQAAPPASAVRRTVAAA
jgi:hypothetical protein